MMESTDNEWNKSKSLQYVFKKMLGGRGAKKAEKMVGNIESDNKSAASSFN